MMYLLDAYHLEDQLAAASAARTCIGHCLLLLYLVPLRVPATSLLPHRVPAAATGTPHRIQLTYVAHSC